MSRGGMTQPLRMTRYERLSIGIAFLTLLATFGGIVSLVYLIRQTATMVNTLESTAFQAVQEQLLDFNKLFLDYPKLRPYFESKKEIVDRDDGNEDYSKVLAISDIKINLFDSFLTQAKHIPGLRREGPALNSWMAYIHDSFASSPEMGRRLDIIQNQYVSILRAVLSER